MHVGRPNDVCPITYRRSFPCPLPSPRTDTTADVNTALALSTKVKALKDLLGADPVIWNDVKTNYDTNLKATADAAHTGETVWEAFKTYFGSATFTTDYVYKAITGTATGFTDVESRKEMVEKTAMDMLIMHEVISLLYRGSRGTDAARQALWDQGAATFIGTDSSATTHGRSQKRGGNYGTLDTTTSQSNANKAVIAALNAGKAAQVAGNTANVQAEYEKIVAQFKVTYAQATLRYANLVDKALAKSENLVDKHAEGAAFARAILPWVSSATAGTAAAKVIEDVYDVAKTPQSANNYLYCVTKQALGVLGISAADMGNLDSADGSTSWTGVTITCATSVPGYTIAPIVTPAGTYTPTKHVGGSLEYANAVKTVSAQISSGTNEAIYNAFMNSGLKGIANKPRATLPDQTEFAAALGGAQWLSATFEKTTGTGASWTPTLGAASKSARQEIQAKSVQDNIAVMAILDDLHVASNTDDADLRASLWDNGAAKYMSTAFNADSKYTIYERATKRGANYGTKSADGTYANVNKKVVDALKAAKASGTKTEMAAQLAVIRKQIKVIYAQAALRYAWKVNTDLTTGQEYMEHLGEGMIFWLNIAPYVKTQNATGYAVVDAFYQVDFTAPPESFNYYSYCALKEVLEKFLASEGVQADMGTLEGTSAAYCEIATSKTVVPSSLPKIASKAGDYVPATDVGSSMALSDGVAAVKAAISNISPSGGTYADVSNAYTNTGIKGHVDTNKAGEAVWNLFKASTIMGKSSKWISDLLTLAFSGNTAGYDVASARAEVMEKTAMDAASVQLILSDLANGAKGTTAQHRLYWDRGAAKYMGSAANGRGSTVYARANKRGANYGTMHATSGDAKSNHAVVAALTAGASATTAVARKAQYDVIETQVKVIYSQATLRYAFKIDNDVKDSLPYAEHQAEGYAFWRVIAPFVEVVDALGAKYVEGIFDPAGGAPVGSDHYCLVKSVLDKQNFAAADFGTLEKTSAVDCSGKKLPTTSAEVDKLLNQKPPAAKTPSAPAPSTSLGHDQAVSGSGRGVMPSALAMLASVALAIVFA